MSSTDARSGLFYGWSKTTEDFAAQHDANLLRLGVLGFGCAIVKSRTTGAPPGSPADGDAYMLPTTGVSGAWASFADKLVVRRAATSAWEVFTPPQGCVLSVIDEGVICRKLASGTSTGVAC